MYVIWVYFVAMVFIGAFFLMNLTLAVINASFVNSQKEMAEEKVDDTVDDQNEANLDDIDVALLAHKPGDSNEIGIDEFFIAKRAAKKMIEFLR
jgi:hypothetical protein